MQNPIPKFRQNSTITVTSGYLSEKTKNSDELQLPENIFLLTFCTPLLLHNVYKRVFGIFFIYLSAIWLAHSQLWVTINGATLLTCVNHCVFDTNFNPKVDMKVELGTLRL